jgi:hypothetical protein
VASRGTPTSQEFLGSNLWLKGPTFLTTGEWPEQKEDLIFQDISRESLIPLSAPSLNSTEQIQEESNITTTAELPLILGINWVKSCEKALAFIRERAGTHPAWANVLKHFQEPIRKQRLLETLVVWSAQQKHCQEIIKALRSDKIPGPLRNLVTFHNLQLVHVEELADLEIIVSKRRNIRTTRKRVEKLRRRYLPNGRVTRRKARNAGCLKELENSLLECETGDMLLYVPPCSKAARHLVSHYHTVVTAHGSIRIVELTLQQQWLIPKLTRIYKDVRKHCVNCKLVDANPTKIPEGDLLSERVESRFPFQVTGVDFSGPFDVLRSQRTKLYICIFADAYTRAVSLQVMPDRSYDSFLMAFERFKLTFCVRPSLMRSDNEKTFQCAATQERLRNDHFNIEWHFNPPQTSWWGGIYERLIRMMKEKLARCYNRQRFNTYAEFELAVKYLETVINSRPIYAKKDPVTQRYTALRPCDFIFNHSKEWFDEEMTNIFKVASEASATRQELDEGQKRLQKFRKRVKLLFDECYVDTLRTFHKNKIFARQGQRGLLPKEGDAVLIKPAIALKENSLYNKIHWPIGEIKKVYSDSRGIRFLDVWYIQEGKEKMFARHPIQHFALLEMPFSIARKFALAKPEIHAL